MSSSEPSEDSEQKFLTDKRIDTYFPTPIGSNAVSQLTEKGYKPISISEEANLLSQGIMTYYRGHVRSNCCEACDDALRTSDKYARSKVELKPVQVQKHKYIDKRKIDCEKYANGQMVPTELQTGQIFISKTSTVHHEEEQGEDVVENYFHAELYNHISSILEVISQASLISRNPYDVIELLVIIVDYDLADLFFRGEEKMKAFIKILTKYISDTTESIRRNIFREPYFDVSANAYAVFATIVLVMLEEYTMREGLEHFIKTFLISISKEKSTLSFKGMIKGLANLPVYKENLRGAANVKFVDSNLHDSHDNEEFQKKRRKMDIEPDVVTGKRIVDINYKPN